jgi:hypothetical protein
MSAEEHSPRLDRRLAAIYGVGVGLAAGWAIDWFSTRNSQEAVLFIDALPSLVGGTLAVLIATLLLLRARTALIGAGVALIVVALLGLSGQGSPPIPFATRQLEALVIRVAHQPAIWATATIWLTIGIRGDALGRRGR